MATAVPDVILRKAIIEKENIDSSHQFFFFVMFIYLINQGPFYKIYLFLKF